MANTFNFGSGKWAAKAGSVLAYNSENNNFKPLPFTFTRASTATRVNESGLIESVASGVPRIDFLDNADGHLLLEPSRTNLFLRSEEFDSGSWGKGSGSITANDILSPDGNLTADKFVEDSTTNTHYVNQTVTTTSGVSYSFSVFAKASERDFIRISRAGGSVGVGFDLVNGTLVAAAGTSGIIQDYGNGWYKCIMVFDTNSTSTQIRIELSTSLSSSVDNYLGDGVSGVYLWGAQIELGSYATSYIPTSGAAVTRAAESAYQTPLSGIIGQTEGTIFAEVDFIDTNADQMYVTISDNTANNRIHIGFDNASNWLYCNIRSGGAAQGLIIQSSPSAGIKKIAVGYKLNDYVLYINGVQIGVDSSALVPACNRLNVGGYFTAGYEYPIKSAKLYNTRLSNSELAALTSL